MRTDSAPGEEYKNYERQRCCYFNNTINRFDIVRNTKEGFGRKRHWNWGFLVSFWLWIVCPLSLREDKCQTLHIPWCSLKGIKSSFQFPLPPSSFQSLQVLSTDTLHIELDFLQFSQFAKWPPSADRAISSLIVRGQELHLQLLGSSFIAVFRGKKLSYTTLTPLSLEFISVSGIYPVLLLRVNW